MNKIIDSHIHLDQYSDEQIVHIMSDLDSIQCTHLISVSYHLKSCKKNMQLAESYRQIKPAFGYHPEQNLPTEKMVDELFAWITKKHNNMVAIGEVGLPYYLREEVGASFQITGYVELLEAFIKLAKRVDKPIVLHAVYDDAPIVCELLEKHNFHQAHFHWFKGDRNTITRMVENGYYVSITPDILYEEEIQHLVNMYPLEQLMIETDGPWEFSGEFSGKMTHPQMMHRTVAEIAKIKQMALHKVYQTLYENTKRFYEIGE